MYPATESDRSESGPFVCYFFIPVFIRRAPVEDNTASERICTVVATYGCKSFTTIRLRCERVCTDTMRFANDTPRLPVHAA